MAVDSTTGKIRALKAGEALEATEVVFEKGEKVEIKGCAFEVVNIAPDPTNEITLKGVAKPK